MKRKKTVITTLMMIHGITILLLLPLNPTQSVVENVNVKVVTEIQIKSTSGHRQSKTYIYIYCIYTYIYIYIYIRIYTISERVGIK